MKKFKMPKNLFVPCLAVGYGSSRNYSYFVNGIRVKTKSIVYEAIQLGVSNISRKDKIMGTIEKFDYESLSFK